MTFVSMTRIYLVFAAFLLSTTLFSQERMDLLQGTIIDHKTKNEIEELELEIKHKES